MLLERARGADARSPGTAHAVIPPLQRIVDTTGDRDALVALTKALTTVDPGQARSVLYTGYDALRLKYLRPDPRDIALSHYNLANQLIRTSGYSAEQRAHRIAAALTAFLTNDGYYFTLFFKPLVREVREHTAAAPGNPPLPTTLAEVIALLGAPRVWWRLDSPQMLWSGWLLSSTVPPPDGTAGLIIFRFCFIEHLSSCAVHLPA